MLGCKLFSSCQLKCAVEINECIHCDVEELTSHTVYSHFLLAAADLNELHTQFLTRSRPFFFFLRV